MYKIKRYKIKRYPTFLIKIFFQGSFMPYSNEQSKGDKQDGKLVQ